MNTHPAMTTPTTLYAAADAASQAVTDFYAASVGGPLDSNRDFVLLMAWQEANAAAVRAARAAGHLVELRFYRAQIDECAMFLDLWRDAA